MIAKSYLAVGARLKRLLGRAIEQTAWGGELRERLLIALLHRHYESVFRRQWLHSETPPHYFDHRIDSFAFVTGTWHPYGYYRGFFAAELVREGDTLLDIGCGDGFFTRRFFAPKCAHVDAVDVDPGAIQHARRLNSAQNITYWLMDAATAPFPSQRYDVVVLDGSLGHFDAAASRRLVHKIRDALTDDGVFLGSESLGMEGDDHLQFFDTLADLALILGDRFEHVQLRSIDYVIPSGSSRREAYWRCANRESRLQGAAWQSHVELAAGEATTSNARDVR